VPAALEEVRQLREQRGNDDDHRHQRQRQQQQGRDEGELLRSHVGAAELETDARDDRVAGNQAGDEQRVGAALVREQQRDRGHDRDERGCGQGIHDPLTAGHLASAALARLTDQLLG
jgi:hypothetical protein